MNEATNKIISRQIAEIKEHIKFLQTLQVDQFNLERCDLISSLKCEINDLFNREWEY
jgi:hypothetical protein